MRNYFSHNLRIFPVGYKKLKKPQLAYLSNMKSSCNRCVCNTVIIFYYNGIPLEMFLLSIKFNEKSRLPGIQDSMRYRVISVLIIRHFAIATTSFSG